MSDTTAQLLTKENIVSAINEIMIDTGCSQLKAITALQGVCAKAGACEILEMLCKMKREILKY